MSGPYVTITHDALSLTVKGPLQLSPLYIRHGTPSPDPNPRCPRYQTWEPLVPSPPDIIHGTLSIMVLTYGMRSWKAGGKHAYWNAFLLKYSIGDAKWPNNC